MLVLVMGGSASGKSAFAEAEAVNLSENGPLYYLATLDPGGPGNDSIIENHRRRREGKGFMTIEAGRNLDRLELWHADSATVLLECLSGLLANEMFFRREPEAEALDHGTENEIHVTEKTVREVLALSGKVKHLIVVSDLIFSDGITYEKETADYIRSLGIVNTAILKAADRAAEIVCTCPVCLK